MADPALTDVLTDAASMLGDPAQDQFTNAILQPFFEQAYREMWDLFMRWNLQTANRTAFYTLPAQTNRLKPSQAGITDMGEPAMLWERGGVTSATITGVSNATPMVVTAVGHGFNTNDVVSVSGVVGPVGVNDEWIITVLTSDTFSLNGSVAGGAYSSGGTAAHSDERWVEMNPTGDLPQTSISDILRYWKWEADTFYFKGSTEARQLKIEYSMSGVAPTSGTIGVDNSRNFLAARTASKAAAVYDRPGAAKDLAFDCFGPSLQPDGTGGYLRALANPMLKEKQKRPSRPQAFRPRRNTLSRNIW